MEQGPVRIVCWKARALVPRNEATALSEALEALEPAPSVVSAFETGDRDLWEVEAYFDCAPDPNTLSASTHVEMRVEAVPDSNWIALSLQGLPPVRAGRFLVHGAHARPRLRDGAVPLEIEASTAFGTGHHGTTRGCLLALDTLLKQRRFKRAIDVGCGTGVLAFAFAKATGSPALASDIDVEAVEKALAFARSVGVAPKVSVFRAAGFQAERYHGTGRADLIFANILLRPLLGLIPDIAKRLQPGGIAILSGLLAHQEIAIRERARGFGLAFRRRYRLEAWVTLVFERRERGPRPLGRRKRAR